MTESQNHRMREGQGKSSIAATFSKRGYNYHSSTQETRAVRGSDYSPAIVLSQEKDKLVTENWRVRKQEEIIG